MHIYEWLLIFIMLIVSSCCNTCSDLTRKYYKENDNVHIILNQENNDSIDFLITCIDDKSVDLKITNFTLSEGKYFFISHDSGYYILYNDEEVEIEGEHKLFATYYYPIYDLSVNSYIKLKYYNFTVKYSKISITKDTIKKDEYEGVEITLYE